MFGRRAEDDRVKVDKHNTLALAVPEQVDVALAAVVGTLGPDSIRRVLY
jgi:hypothetical protein